MTCLEYLFADLDTQIDCEIDCVGCEETDCPYDQRKNDKSIMKRSDNNVL
jgi:hypothetical protein